MEEPTLHIILEKIANVLQRTHRRRAEGYRVDHELRSLDWLNSKAEKLLQSEASREPKGEREDDSAQKSDKTRR